MFDSLKQEACSIGKPEWHAMLLYVAGLHDRSVRPAQPPFPFDWEEIGPGYCYGPAFGHWDIVHAVIDVLPSEPEHARRQLLNNIAAQQPDGMIPGVLWVQEGKITWNREVTHPPLWEVAVQDLVNITGSRDLILQCRSALVKLIRFFEAKRSAEHGGFYYCDILTRLWESGVDQGIRFDDAPKARLACVDATSHIYWLYEYASAWYHGEADASEFRHKALVLKQFIQDMLYDPETGYFYDEWQAKRPGKSAQAFEGMWPIVTGAASFEQAAQVIDRHLLNGEEFFGVHPICSVAMDSPKFELRMWRGPSWNSMAYWAARGCIRYGRKDAAKKILEAALDDTARQFAKTSTIWEFYHPYGQEPSALKRKEGIFDVPCRDYLGHNPVIAMARMWETL